MCLRNFGLSLQMLPHAIGCNLVNFLLFPRKVTRENRTLHQSPHKAFSKAFGDLLLQTEEKLYSHCRQSSALGLVPL